MILPIVRLYESAAKAAAAVAALREFGIAADAIRVVAPPDKEPSRDAVAKDIMSGLVLRAHAVRYAEQVVAGRTLVSVRAPFGMSGLVIDMLEAAGPVAYSLPPVREKSVAWDEATPLSSALFLPVLKRGAAPFSDLWGLRTLKKGLSPLAFTLGDPSASSETTSEMFGMPTVVRRRPGWSTSFGLPLLKRVASGWSSSFGMPLLSRGGRGPWTTSFGLPLLARNPAPLSSLFGLRAVSGRD